MHGFTKARFSMVFGRYPASAVTCFFFWSLRVLGEDTSHSIGELGHEYVGAVSYLFSLALGAEVETVLTEQ